MKMMKKLFFTLIVITFCIISTNAQDESARHSKINLSMGAELSKPIGLFGEVYSWGIGATVQVNFPIASNTAFTLYTGYNRYFLKNTYGGGSDGFIPALGGVEVNLFHNVYGSIQSGFTFYAQDGGSVFTYSPGIGFRIQRHFTALVKYTGRVKSAINSGAIGVRVAYTFRK